MTTVKETDRTFVKAYVQDYADAITENYRLYHIDSMEHMLKRDPESIYPAQELNDIQTGKANLMKFVVKTGKKYYKIVQQELKHGRRVSIMVNIVMEVFTHLLIKKLAKFINLHHGELLLNTLDLMSDERQLKFLLDPKNVGWRVVIST